MVPVTLVKRKDVAVTEHARHYDEMRWMASGCEAALGFLRTMRTSMVASASQSREGPGGYMVRRNRMDGEQSRMEDIDQAGWSLVGKERRRVADQRVHLCAMRDPPWCEGGCETLKGKGPGQCETLEMRVVCARSIRRIHCVPVLGGLRLQYAS